LEAHSLSPSLDPHAIIIPANTLHQNSPTVNMRRSQSTSLLPLRTSSRINFLCINPTFQFIDDFFNRSQSLVAAVAKLHGGSLVFTDADPDLSATLFMLPELIETTAPA
jgi:hypothetical protein